MALAQSGAGSAPWTLLAPALEPRVEAPGVVVEGKLYVFAGFTDADLHVTGSVEVYDPVQNTWTPRAPMPRPVTHVGTAVVGREVWFVGGFEGDNPGSAVKAVQVYDTGTDTWRVGPPLPARRASGTLAAVGRTLHHIGGLLPDRQTDVGDHYVLNLDRPQDGWRTAAPLPVPRNHLSSAVYGGRIYAIGGQQGHDEGRRFRSELHAYDPATDTWARRADLPIRRSHFEPGTFVWDGRIVIVGGVGRGADNNRAMDQITAYDPQSDTWTELDPLPVRLLGPVAQVIDGQLIVTHGGLDLTEDPQNTARSRSLNQPPVASFAAAPDGASPLTLRFDASDSSDPDGSVVGYTWAFGDGATGSGKTVAHTYAAAGTYTATLTVTDNGGAAGTAQQTVTAGGAGPGPFVEADGLVVAEAEHTHESVARGGQSWTATPASGAVGTALGVLPNTGANINAGFVDTSPELRFRVRFSTPGTYYVWGRVLAGSDDDDSFHAGIGGAGPASADRIFTTDRAQLVWANRTMDQNSRATITVASAGEHVVSVWMREDGLVLDRLLLTTSASFTPSGAGPPESARGAGGAGPVAEAGTVTVSQPSGDAWHAVPFERPFTDPVVVAGPASSEGSDPVTVRVRNVTPTGFELQLDEWDYLDGRHVAETVSWLAVESGVHQLDGGGLIEAGLVGASETMKTYGLGAGFASAPVLVSQVVTAGGGAVVTRQRNVTAGSFQLRIQAQESADYPGAETVAYVAVEAGAVAGVLEAGRTPDAVGDLFHEVGLGTGFASAPALLASMQTFDGADPATLRYRALTGSRFEVRAEEEQSADEETDHTDEVVGYLAIAPGGLLGTPLAGALEASAPTGPAGAGALLESEPAGYALEPPFPNPFHSVTSLHYALPEAADVRLDVFDALGHRVALLVDGRVEAGRYVVRFDGAGFASGVYFFRFQAGPFSETRRMALLR
ncbi:hypothetical protein BSZ37_09565 [Rubrivirga marina]|uniref:PKD domain-containing protein n=1 Tax=Rubrivirga marina TaxID=1196024 RepID=A0A271IZX4_9BACT|nr:hypothetical protein BSZ37_09565 [Rubrivirga marina]